MQTLSLYVDKWFIFGAINKDGTVLPVSLPDGEDRIWLFFHEDTTNNRIVYGKSFGSNYRDKEPHYFGDIFSLIETGDAHFTRYDNRPEEMKEIFNRSGIFAHLRDAITETETEIIDTYLSFSDDIPDVARLKFIEELREAGFNPVESIARISHLALEESKKRGIFTQVGHYLVLVATNDNLHYTLYEHTENLFIRKNKASLPGFGLDVRRRALIETVVENINRTTHFLSTPKEYTAEYMRQDRFVDGWLRKIANRNRNIPVTFPDITFAVAPNNPYPVTIKPATLDDRTNGIVDDIVRKIADFVHSNQLQPHEINGIVFIGNTFTNTQFTTAINNRFIVDNDKIVLYRETELPKLVSIYTQIDCSQFKAATEEFVQGAKARELLNQQTKEEEERQKAAQAEARRQQEVRDQRRKADQEYENAIENVARYESDHDYEQMREWADIALTHRPEDKYAQEKSELAQQLLAEQRAANKQFSTFLQRAKSAFAEARWSDAISQSDMALELRSNSEEAKEIKKESCRQVEIENKVTNFLNRADLFLAQKLYNEALEEADKVLNLDATNEAAKEIQRKISEVHAKQKRIVDDLLVQLNEAENKKDFSRAVEICDFLLEEDIANLRKWAEKRELLKSKECKFQENKQKLSDLRTAINKALFEEEWQQLVSLCESALAIEKDAEIEQFLAKAQQKIAGQKVQDAKNNALGRINSLLLDKKFHEAEKELNLFARNYPMEHAIVKDLRRKLFDFGAAIRDKTAENKSVTEADNFFSSPDDRTKHEEKKTRYSNDDFSF